GVRLGDVDAVARRRQADAVRPAVHREGHLADARAVGARVVDAGAVAVALPHLAEVGEPEAPRRVEDESVRALERMLAALRVERLDLAALHIDALDAAAAVALR